MIPQEKYIFDFHSFSEEFIGKKRKNFCSSPTAKIASSSHTAKNDSSPSKAVFSRKTLKNKT